jgi:acetolactate synthase-1/2/3 large subunit
VVLVVDHDVPYIPTRTHIRPDARIAQIDLDPIKERIPLWSFPLDLAIKADSAAALPLLADYAGDALGSGDRERLAARRADLGARGASLRAEWRRAASRAADVRPIAPAWLGACLDELRRGAPDVVFVDETVTNTTTLMQQIATCEPGTWFKSGGSGLGWGLGAAIGVKQALPDRPTLALVGDGSFIFGTPLAALWTARAHGAAILVVVLNNGGYAATRAPLLAAYPNGASARTDTFFGIDLEPPPRFDLEAATVDAYGERVEDPSELLAALGRGLEHVRGGQSAVLDVILARPGAARAVSSETGRP